MREQLLQISAINSFMVDTEPDARPVKLLNCENCFLQNIPARNANFIFNDEVGLLFWFKILITSKSDNFI